MSRKKKATGNDKAKVHSELDGFELRINELGEVESNLSQSRINEFLTKHVSDKKLGNVVDAATEKDVDA